ncbi:hypothetical protein OCH239_21725 [Roseivivax halodurans JCM 10272]|uniref:Uncharacterized protein n=1 Tax=Roseivivax halodurans JCM 10272 TaxID=1449350 RepID=X7EFJ5_9RHOB|nr:hypothetical protein [Roseivivax halodurans]ETX14717.1 hypothetical protein OCH239_21725 [Roseivivax halodurans JCM 10272]
MTQWLKTLGEWLAALAAPKPALVRVPARAEAPRRPASNRDRLTPRR